MIWRSLLILQAAAIGLTALLWFQSPASSNWPPTTSQLLLTALLLMEVGAFVVIAIPYRRQLLKTAHATAQAPSQQSREQLDQQLRAETQRIEQQSRKLADQYRVIHEWMDYPPILDLKTGDRLPGQTADPGPSPSPAQMRRLDQQDQAVKTLLDERAGLIYEKIRKNDYSPQGKFQPVLLRDDLLDVAIRIAQLYQPQLENPLLSTTPEQLARALNRIGLHLLVVMDQLPLDLKSYNIQKTYDTVRHAITTYGHYKKASPYLDWASKGLYVGRMVTTTNPIALGLFWGATELGKYGAQKLATHLIDRQAIGLLQSVIRVVGYEVAAIYGGDFRHRDPNWCYAVEVTQLLAAFPASRESLQFGMQEVGRLQLRNEYDRLAVYRCLAAGKVIDRGQTHPDLLTEVERREIIELLEKACQQIVHGQGTSSTEKWKQGVQDHLGLQLSLDGKANQPTHTQRDRQDQQILDFLIGFLTHVKLIAADQLEDVLLQANLPGRLGVYVRGESFRTELANLQGGTPDAQSFNFLPPDVDPNDPRLGEFFKVLCQWNANFTPYSNECEQMILETAFYFRRPLTQISSDILNAYRAHLVEQVPELKPQLDDRDSPLARALLFLQQDQNHDPRQFVTAYDQLTLEPSTGTQTNQSVKHQLFAFETFATLVRSAGLETPPESVWLFDSQTRLDNRSTLLLAVARLSGGYQPSNVEMVDENRELSAIQITAPMTARYQSYFAPLIRLTELDQMPSSTDS